MRDRRGVGSDKWQNHIHVHGHIVPRESVCFNYPCDLTIKLTVHRLNQNTWQYLASQVIFLLASRYTPVLQFKHAKPINVTYCHLVRMILMP
ncbi:hypothetical protein VTK73DRAFT_5102 [Phialemonium thermophilum]|uniref:Uncharacterized protein n=1 Tax=Phialemonium thermophilum TaxID=223376 RepID=A0ABR3WPS2_9PEZI